ncbi:MAG: hypothetical protein KKB79_00435 [Nanoarchaeota archaeon]|nr:hypothetical protein [Nanoarchaeota archaeon]
MRKAILDTSFIITAAKNKIDFFKWLEEEGLEPVIPEQTISELEGLGAELPLKLIKMHKFKLAKVSGKNADTAIVNLTKKDKKAIVATLDAGLKKRIKNRKLVIRGGKKLEIT